MRFIAAVIRYATAADCSVGAHVQIFAQCGPASHKQDEVVWALRIGLDRPRILHGQVEGPGAAGRDVSGRWMRRGKPEDVAKREIGRARSMRI